MQDRTAAVLGFGNDLDAEPAIAVLIRSTDRIFEAGRRDCVNHGLNVLAHEPVRPFGSRFADATPVEPMAMPSTTADMATSVLRAQ